MSSQRDTRGGSGRGSGGRPPRRPLTLTGARTEAGNAYWNVLQDEARAAVDTAMTGADTELYLVVTANWELLARLDQHPHESDQDVMVRLIATFLERAGKTRRSDGLNAVDAIFWLTDAEWIVEEALDDLVEAEAVAENPEAGEQSWLGPSASSSSDPLDDLPREYREINRLNPNTDRTPAIKGRVTESKLTVSLRMPGDKGVKQLHFNKYEQGTQMNWNDPAHIRELNRWRTQQLRRDLGPVREGRIYFHPEERQWLTELYKCTEKAALMEGKRPNFRSMKWDELTEDFNKHFAGQVLNKGERPRPFRTKPSILTERYRIPEVCRVSGLKAKASQRTGKGKRVTKEEDKEEDHGDDNDDAKDGDTGGGSGSNGKNKSPEKK